MLAFALLVMLLVNMGCVPLSAGRASANRIASGEVLFSDDFSQPPSGWGIWTREGAKVEYRDQGLRIWVGRSQHDFWSVAGQDFQDVQIEVDVTRLDGPDNNDFGLLCRYLDMNNFYMLVVTSDGYYGIAKMLNGRYSMIGSDQLQYTGTAIHPGQASNHLRADCTGTTLRLYANGQKLMETRDSDFVSGDVGVLAGAYDTPGVDLLFDNFVVKQP